MRYSLVCFFVIILGLKAFASNEIGGLEWSVYPTPETTTELPEELRLEFYGVQDGKWVPSGALPDEWNEFITLKDPAGNILPIKACYTGSAVNGMVGVTINLGGNHTEAGKYTLEIKEGIYLNRAVESASYVPSPDITVDYEIGGNWLPTNDLSAINPTEFMNIGYDSYAGSGVPYITKDGKTVATCTGYKGAYESDPSRYLIFDNDLSTPGIYQLVIPAQSICWDEGENVCSNEYTEQNFKLISPMKNMITWPAKGSKVFDPTFLLVVLPELTRPIDEFKRNMSFEIYKDGEFAGTMKPSPLWYGDFDFGCGFWRQEPGLYKITIPADAVEIGDFSKPLPEDVVFEFEIVTEEEAGVELISPSDETGASGEIYDLSGKKISGDPMPGIYIIRTQSTVRKIVVR